MEVTEEGQSKREERKQQRRDGVREKKGSNRDMGRIVREKKGSNREGTE